MVQPLSLGSRAEYVSLTHRGDTLVPQDDEEATSRKDGTLVIPLERKSLSHTEIRELASESAT